MMTAMLIAMLTAVTVWWLLIQRLKEKPWLTQGVVPTSQETLWSSGPRVGLWIFLAVVSSLFGLFASAYVMRMHGHGGLVSWQRLDEPSILWINTLVLVLASPLRPTKLKRRRTQRLTWAPPSGPRQRRRLQAGWCRRQGDRRRGTHQRVPEQAHR